MLENKEDQMIGPQVQERACSINIDAKLVANQDLMTGSDDAKTTIAKLSDMVSLEKGCACCSASEELFVGPTTCFSLQTLRGRAFDHIVIDELGRS